MFIRILHFNSRATIKTSRVVSLGDDDDVAALLLDFEFITLFIPRTEQLNSHTLRDLSLEIHSIVKIQNDHLILTTQCVIMRENYVQSISSESGRSKNS